MKLTEFRIENYRSIQDSGWVRLDDIAVVVGKNESGKTSLLKALWKFNPFHKVQYDLDRDWPRGRRKDKSPHKVVATVRFQFHPDELALIRGIHDSARAFTGVEIKRTYKGTYLYNFLPQNPGPEYDLPWVVSLLHDRLSLLPAGFSEHFQQHYAVALKEFVEDVRTNGGTQYALAKMPAFKERFASLVHPVAPYQQSDQFKLSELNRVVDDAVNELNRTPLQPVIDAIHRLLPTFIYMDDCRIFRGSAQLDEIKKRKDAHALTEEDETLITIMEMAGLDLDQEYEKGQTDHKEQRMLDLNDASITLTEKIASQWSQKGYEVRFELDGQHFITFVKDAGVTALVPLEERSKGFQWFFSFDLMFMHDTNGRFENTVILLDEPGLHLHAAAQADLLKRLRAYAEKNQLIYTTHLPFMIDFNRLDNLYVAEELPKEGVKIHRNWATADPDARYTLQAALGLSWSESLFASQPNLIVENVTDLWFLTAISTMLRDAGQEGLDEELLITPVGGATKAAYFGAILRGQKRKVALLLDSTTEGRTAYEQLVKQWSTEARQLLRLGDVLGAAESRTLEDLFEESYYLNHVIAAYRKELAGLPLSLPPGDKRGVVERIQDALKAKGIPNFNKARVAKRILDELLRKKLADLPRDTVEKFKKVIAAINATAADWKKVPI